MTAPAPEVVRRFKALDSYLQTKGFPATSPEWHRQIERWYTSGVLQFVGRVGRGGGKSSTICRLAVCEALYGKHHINPGDTGIVTIVSASKDDANDRLETIRAILIALGYSAVRRGTPPGPKHFLESAEEISIPHLRVAFRVYAASFRALSGFTSIFIFLDEVAKWRDEKTGVSPATEVFASVSATRRSKPKKIALISSPLGLKDLHADLFAQGDTDAQIVWHAPTWVANPTVTEADCRTQEPNEVRFQREYGAIPTAEDELSVFEGAQVTRATRTTLMLPADERHRYVATIDPATRGNAWTFVISCLSDQRVRRVVFNREWRGTKGKPLVPGEVFKEIKPTLTAYGLRILFSDQFSADSLVEIARQQGIALIIEPWTSQLKEEAYENLRTLFQESKIELPPDPQVTSDLLGVRQKIGRNGLTYDLATSGGRHSDYAPAVALAVLKSIIPCTPLRTSQTLEQEAQAAKARFLSDLTKRRERAERRGQFRPSRR